PEPVVGPQGNSVGEGVTVYIGELFLEEISRASQQQEDRSGPDQEVPHYRAADGGVFIIVGYGDRSAKSAGDRDYGCKDPEIWKCAGLLGGDLLGGAAEVSGRAVRQCRMQVQTVDLELEPRRPVRDDPGGGQEDEPHVKTPSPVVLSGPGALPASAVHHPRTALGPCMRDHHRASGWIQQCEVRGAHG